MTYRLLNDIDFEGVDCSKLEQIKENDKFNDIFDGEGHTILHLAPKTQWGTTGLFAKIGISGILKNIHIKSCNSRFDKSPSSKQGAGILAGINYGIITNCSVENGVLNSTEQSTPTGGIVGYSYGDIINCSTTDMTIKGKDNFCGGIVGVSQGNIINCFSANNNIAGTGSNGGISGESIPNPTTAIYNCYVYALQIKKLKGGLFYGTATNSTVIHCFYPSASFALIGSGSNNQATNNQIFQSDFTYDSTPIYQLLNEWINSQAPILYPNFTFTHWTDGGNDLPAIFLKQ